MAETETRHPVMYWRALARRMGDAMARGQLWVMAYLDLEWLVYEMGLGGAVVMGWDEA